MLAQTLTSGPGQRRLPPLLLAPCELPLRLGAIARIDFTEGAEVAPQLARLAGAIRSD